MQVENGTDHVDMTIGGSVPLVKQKKIDVSQTIQTQIIVFILISICFVYTLNTLITNISKDTDETNGRQFARTRIAFVSLLYYGFGLIVTFKKYPNGLRAFIHMAIILIIFTTVAFVRLLLPRPLPVPIAHKRSIVIQLVVFIDLTTIIVMFGIKLIQLFDPDGCFMLDRI